MRRSHSKTVASLACMLLLSAIVAYGQEQKTAAPHIVFSGMRFDAGTVKEGAIVNHAFEFSNDGQAALRIRDVIPA